MVLNSIQRYAPSSLTIWRMEQGIPLTPNHEELADAAPTPAQRDISPLEKWSRKNLPRFNGGMGQGQQPPAGVCPGQQLGWGFWWAPVEQKPMAMANGVVGGLLAG